MIKFTLSVPTLNENWWESSRNEIARILQEDNRAAWGEEKDPQEGQKWAPLSARYKEWKSQAYPGQPILRLTGRMQDRTRIRPEQARGFFSATMGADYGRYHMTGTSKMPARPWLGIPVMSMPRVEAAVAKAILKGPNRRF